MKYFITWWNANLDNVVERWTNQEDDLEYNSESFTSKKVRVVIGRWSIETTELPPTSTGAIIEVVAPDRHLKVYRLIRHERIEGKLHIIETSEWTFTDQTHPIRVSSDNCPFEYRGVLCGYDGDGYTVDGEPTAKRSATDICPRTNTACKLRFGNKYPYGGMLF